MKDLPVDVREFLERADSTPECEVLWCNVQNKTILYRNDICGGWDSSGSGHWYIASRVTQGRDLSGERFRRLRPRTHSGLWATKDLGAFERVLSRLLGIRFRGRG